MIRSEQVRFFLLRNGIEYGELFAADTAPTVRMDRSGEIKMSLQGNFLPDALDSRGNKTEVNWLTDEIKPVLTIDGKSEPIGVFMPSKVTPSESRGKKTLNVQALDRCWRVRDTKVEGSVYLSAGTNYLTAVEGLLTSSGITNRIKTPSSAVLAEDREDWKTGDSYLTIVNTLLKEINYKELWFNASGFAILEPASVPTVEKIQHTFTNRKPQKGNQKEAEIVRLYPSITRETDIYETPNVFVCVCSNPDKDAGMRATAENNNPQSPLSIMRRGRRIVKVVNVDNIASQTELQAYADRLVYESMTTSETIRVETMLQQGFGAEDITEIRHNDVFGICVEKAWDMQLTPGGKMTHTLERVVVNIG